MRQIVWRRRFVLCGVFIGGNLCCDEGVISDHPKYTIYTSIYTGYTGSSSAGDLMLISQVGAFAVGKQVRDSSGSAGCLD